MIDCRDVTPNHNGVDPLLVKVDRCQALEASVVITKKAVYPEKPNHAVVTQDLEHIAPTLVVIPVGGGKRLQPLFLPLQNLCDHGLLDECLQVIENPIDIPCLQKNRKNN